MKLPMDIYMAMENFYSDDKEFPHTMVLTKLANRGLKHHYDSYEKSFWIRWEDESVTKHRPDDWRRSLEAPLLQANLLGLRKLHHYDPFG